MKPKWAILLFLTAICLSCASGPAPERNPKHLREGIYNHNKGAELFTKGCYQRAMAYFQDSHQIYAAADEQAGVAQALNSIADTYFRMGDMESALLVYGDAIALSESEKNGRGTVACPEQQSGRTARTAPVGGRCSRP